MGIIDKLSGLDFAYKGFQYPLPPSWKKMVRQQDQIEWLLQAILELSDKGANIDDVTAKLQEFKEQFDAEIPQALQSWIDEHLEQQAKDALNAAVNAGVYFGVNEQGYFVAYVPDSWDEIEFDTGAEFGTERYGRLILKYNVEANETVNQEVD